MPLYTPKENTFECKERLFGGCQGCIFSRSCAQFDGTRGNLDAAVQDKDDYSVTLFDKRSGRKLWTANVHPEKERRGC